MTINDTALLLSAFTLYFCLAFILPTLRVWRQTGKNPYVLPSGDDAFGLVSRAMKLLMGSLFAYFAARLLWPAMTAHIGVLSLAGLPGVRAAGWSLLLAAIVSTLAAQYQMGRSWRIGIDTVEKTALVTTGLFACSRNPIFLAMRACLLALLLIQPNALTLAFFLVGDLVMQVQVRLEEAFLEQQHGQAYARYRAAVRRWL